MFTWWHYLFSGSVCKWIEGNRQLEMAAEKHDGGLGDPEHSDPLNIPKGGSEEVKFTLGRGWLHNGEVTVTTAAVLANAYLLLKELGRVPEARSDPSPRHPDTLTPFPLSCAA